MDGRKKNQLTLYLYLIFDYRMLFYTHTADIFPYHPSAIVHLLSFSCLFLVLFFHFSS